MTSLANRERDIFWEGPGGDEVVVLKAKIREAISELYVIEADIKSEQRDLKFEDMIHANARIVLMCGEELTDRRVFSGIITGFAQARTSHGDVGTTSDPAFLYQVEIRPDLWLATKKTYSKVFQDKTSKDIVGECLDELGIAHRWELQSTPPTRDYCLQYEESSYAFVSRLMEEDGICFYFDHDQQQVVFANHAGGHDDCKPNPKAKYMEDDDLKQGFGAKEHIQDFHYREVLSTGNFTLNDYHHETSQTGLMDSETASAPPFFSKLEVYEHTQNYKVSGNVSYYKPLRKEAEESINKVGKGMASCRSFEVGHVFEMTDHYRDDFNAKWLLTSCHISLEQGHYVVHFTCFPIKLNFRPERKTKAPRVYGIQTATVTGPPGAEVYLDDLGRCKIQFHWDREGQKNDRSSIWVRVSNGYAGKDYGIQWIPRVGHEVLVAFLNGMPDHPMVVGRVYNDFNKCPLGPDKKYQNIIKTIKDNHIMFDDEDGKEMIDIRAQKDMNTLVLNNKTITVNNDMTTTVHHDKTIVVDNDMSTTVHHDKFVVVDNNSHEVVQKTKTVDVIDEDYGEYTGRDKVITVQNEHHRMVLDGNEEITICTGNRTTNVNTGDETQNVLTGNRTVNVNTGSNTLNVLTGSHTVNVNTGDMTTTVATGNMGFSAPAKNASFAAGQGVTITGGQTLTAIGNQQVSISGAKVSITATQELTLGVGANTITIKPSGVEVGGVKITSAAIGLHEISGALVKLN
ncbi:Type VI secretion system tip protein VgrG [Sulfidibacter corallicola]|uniref:Type VI secretion system tip protein VgrG n=1 Tax=Sulfidibacter corallicola TaxID=2818388 RepID=A0A8A4TSN4_SULCO|nr:type VI secretion system tip protein TssI/VgrG [Sulfidibacter corallicola]QTD52068.1 type VI secretion system tip protein VgrG [Sulfidibacter corallicola]